MVPKIRSETEFFVILGHFLPFNPKNQNFEKMKKKAQRYYHFYKCVPSSDDNHMMHGS